MSRTVKKSRHDQQKLVTKTTSPLDQVLQTKNLILSILRFVSNDYTKYCRHNYMAVNRGFCNIITNSWPLLVQVISLRRVKDPGEGSDDEEYDYQEDDNKDDEEEEQQSDKKSDEKDSDEDEKKKQARQLRAIIPSNFIQFIVSYHASLCEIRIHGMNITNLMEVVHGLDFPRLTRVYFIWCYVDKKQFNVFATQLQQWQSRLLSNKEFRVLNYTGTWFGKIQTYDSLEKVKTTGHDWRVVTWEGCTNGIKFSEDQRGISLDTCDGNCMETCIDNNLLLNHRCNPLQLFPCVCTGKKIFQSCDACNFILCETCVDEIDLKLHNMCEFCTDKRICEECFREKRWDYHDAEFIRKCYACHMRACGDCNQQCIQCDRVFCSECWITKYGPPTKDNSSEEELCLFCRDV
jgi:hypothetical protein